MTAKDFRFIANVISNLPRTDAVRMKCAQAFADDLRIINPRFDERIFMKACRVPQLIIPASRVKVGDFLCGWGEVARVEIEEDDFIAFHMEIDRADESRADMKVLSCERKDPVRIYVED